MLHATPHDHHAAGPDGGWQLAGRRGIDRRQGSPDIGGRIVPASTVEKGDAAKAAPYKHCAARPDRGRGITRRGRIDRAGRRPGVRRGIVLASRIQHRRRGRRIRMTTPHHHPSPGPHRIVRTPSQGCVDDRCRRPSVRRRVVPASGVDSQAVAPAPYNHQASGPDGRVTVAIKRRVDCRHLRPSVRRGVVAGSVQRL